MHYLDKINNLKTDQASQHYKESVNDIIQIYLSCSNLIDFKEWLTSELNQVEQMADYGEDYLQALLDVERILNNVVH